MELSSDMAAAASKPEPKQKPAKEKKADKGEGGAGK